MRAIVLGMKSGERREKQARDREHDWPAHAGSPGCFLDAAAKRFGGEAATGQ
jgi:hypothetical protein